MSAREGSILGAYAELQTSAGVGPQTTAMLLRVAAQVVRTHSFPPPEGYTRWSGDAVMVLVAQMFEATPDGGKTFVARCVIGAHDDASLERLLVATVSNFLKDQAKATERGKLRRRLETLLGADPRFARGRGSGGAWALLSTVDKVWQGDIQELERSAFAVRGVQISRWNNSGPTPEGTKAALLAVAHGVLSAAAGAVRDEDLARAIEARFGMLAPPVSVSLESDGVWDEAALVADDAAAQPDVVFFVSETASTLWLSMGPVERAVVPLLGGSLREIAAVVGAGPRGTKALVDALTEKIRLATVDDEHGDAVALELARLCGTRR